MDGVRASVRACVCVQPLEILQILSTFTHDSFTVPEMSCLRNAKKQSTMGTVTR